MMECRQVRAVVDGWEHGAAGVSLSGEPGTGNGTGREFIRHLEQCAACRLAYGRIAPLIARDLGAEPGLSAESGVTPDAAAALSDAVMRRLGSGAAGTVPAPRPRAFARPAFALPALAAAAAIAVFVLGLGVGRIIGSGRPDTVTVTFSLQAPQAGTVALAGNFSGWRTDGYALARRPSDGTWELRVTLRKGEVYVYNFVIDGETWIPDPRGEALVDDGFGGEGSLLTL